RGGGADSPVTVAACPAGEPDAGGLRIHALRRQHHGRQSRTLSGATRMAQTLQGVHSLCHTAESAGVLHLLRPARGLGPPGRRRIPVPRGPGTGGRRPELPADAGPQCVGPQASPGFFKGFRVSGRGDEKHTVDLKIQGLTPFVDAARILALANGIRETGTTQRLAQLKQRGVLDALDADAYEEAYQFIQLLRMQQHQSQESLQRAFSNRLAPASLNQLDQRILRESFRQAQRLQSSLSTRYQL